MNVEKVIDSLDLVNRRESETEIMSRCPFPDHIDRHPSFSINKRTGQWICFGCDKKGNIRTLVKLLGLNERQLQDERKLEDRLDRLEWNGRKVSNQGIPVAMCDEYTPCYNVENGVWFLPNFLLKRGVKKGTLKHFKVGFCDKGIWAGYIIIPVYFKGMLKGFIGRYAVAEGEKKYKYSTGMEVSKILFGFDEIKENEPIILVEGVFDYFRIWENGFNVVALFGKSLSNMQKALLVQLKNSKKIRSCWVMLDGDAKKEAKSIFKKLNEVGFTGGIIPLDDNLDPAMLSDEEIRSACEKLSKKV